MKINADDIKWLWVQMIRIYTPASWRNHAGVSDDGVWLDELRGLIREDLERGLSSLRREICAEDKTPYPISPVNFFRHCLPTERELGLPGEEMAYRLAVRSMWDVHAIVYLAVGDIGTYRLKMLSEDKTRKWYGRNYKKLVTQVRMGEVLIIPTIKKNSLLGNDKGSNEKYVKGQIDKGRKCFDEIYKKLNAGVGRRV